MLQKKLITLSKTNYLLYRECKNNTWLKIHKPDIYYEFEPNEFEKLIMKTGNEVELVARKLFPQGILIDVKGDQAVTLTSKYIKEKKPVIFQATFTKDGFFAAVDILEFDSKSGSYSIYEVKSTNSIDEKTHYYDLAFQVSLLKKLGLKIKKINLIHLNKDYILSGDLNIKELFKTEDITEIIESLVDQVGIEMTEALDYLSQELQPVGNCDCLYKGRSKHCTCFSILNPDIPKYGIHDISRIGLSKKKLAELVDGAYFNIDQIPPHIKLSTIQQNQIDTYVSDKTILNKELLAMELKSLIFPLYFIDYETFPSAIPRFKGFSPYQHIIFQYSLYVLDSPDSKPTLLEFLYTDLDDPTLYFGESLKTHIKDKGHIIVWHKDFECGRNEEVSIRLPKMKSFIDSFNLRIFDLETIFKKQYYVHKNFKGSTSIKKVLQVLVPDLTYNDVDIKDGGGAAESWNRLHTEKMSKEEKEKIKTNLKKYCGLDAYAMYAIWKELYKFINS